MDKFNTAGYLHRLCTATDRVAELTAILTELEIPFETEKFTVTHQRFFRETETKEYTNIYVWGHGRKYLCAHHDVVEKQSHNANDNTASLVNCIHALTLAPGLGCFFTDGEEPPHFGAGAKRVVEILAERHIKPQWIFNLDVTGKGSMWWIDSYRNAFSAALYEKFKPLTVATPFNDAVIFEEAGIPTTVATLCEPHRDILGKPDMRLLHTLHSVEDSIDTVSPTDMDRFVTEIIVPAFNEINL